MTTTYSGYQGYPPSSESAVNVVPVVGLWRRFFAAFVDSILLSVLGWFGGAILGVFLGVFIAVTNSESTAMSSVASFIGGCFGIVLNAVYFIGFWATTGQSLGKMLLGLRVVTETGEKPTVGTAVVRYVMYFIGSLIVYIGFAMAAFDSTKQALHDKVAKTYVVPANAEIPVGQPLTFVPENPSNQSDIVAVGLLYLGVCIIPVLTIALLTAMGPQIGEVFESITTPVPVQP